MHSFSTANKLKSSLIFKNIVALTVSLLVTLVGMSNGILYNNVIDLMLSLPIIESFHSFNHYSFHDLIISSGHRIPFFVYRILGLLLQFDIPTTELVYYSFLLSTTASLFFFWWLTFHIIPSFVVASLSTLAVAFVTPSSLSICSTFYPTLCFVSSSVGFIFILASLVALLSERYLLSFILTAITGIVHPGLGIITLLLVSACSANCLSNEIKSISSKYYLVISLLVMLIIGGIASFKLEDNFAFDPNITKDIWPVFYTYSNHTFLEFNWPDRYIQYLLYTSLLFLLVTTLPKRLRIITRIIFITAVAACIAYAFNLYVLKLFPIAHLYLFRITVITKFFAFPIFFYGFINIWSNKKNNDKRLLPFIGLLLLLSVNIAGDQLEVLICSVVTFLIIKNYYPQLLVKSEAVTTIAVSFSLGLYYYGLASSLPWLTMPLFCLSLALFVTAFAHMYLSKEESHELPTQGEPQPSNLTPRIMLCCLIVVALAELPVVKSPFTYERLENIQNHIPHPYQELFTWAKSSSRPGALFMGDPSNIQLFYFRYFAQRSLYIHFMDINQLSYDLAAYRAGAIRMNNMRVIPSRAPFTDQRFPQFTSSYESFSEEELIRLRNTEHIDYGIFSKKIPSLSINPIFESDHIIVYDLHTLSPVQAVTKQKTAN